MSPVSLVAALVGLLFEPRNPARWFDQVIRFGRQTEVWINLFGRRTGQPGIDDLFSNLEERLRQQVEQGGMTAGAKKRIDDSLDRLQEEIGNRVNRQTEKDTSQGDKPPG